MLPMENRTVFTCDNLDLMRVMREGSVDLIYLDPPFNSGRYHSARPGSAAAGSGFRDTWTPDDVDPAWLDEIASRCGPLHSAIRASEAVGGRSVMSYMAYLAIRILEMRRILKPTGSLYLHCDPAMSHHLRLALDAVFGRRRFRSEITWKRSGAHGDGRRHGRISDRLLFYTKTGRYAWNRVCTPYSEEFIGKEFRNEDGHGRYTHRDLTAESLDRGGYEYEYRGHRRVWKRPPESMLGLERDGMIHVPEEGGVPRYKIYLKDAAGVLLQDIWTDIPNAQGRERLGYPTQKPLALLERIIESSSNPGDTVFDPFCGCGTALHAAERLGRRWAGCDISESAYRLTAMRLQDDCGLGRVDVCHATGSVHETATAG